MRPPECELPPGEAKCLPAQHCAQATGCARWLVRMQQGLPVADWSRDPGFRQGACPRCLPAELHRKKAPAPAAPRVHEAPGWLR